MNLKFKAKIGPYRTYSFVKSNCDIIVYYFKTMQL